MTAADRESRIVSSPLWAALLALLVAGALLSGCDVFTSGDRRRERAEAYLQQGQYRAAEIELKKLLRKEAGHARARALLGQAEYMVGDVGAAERDLERALLAGASRDHVDPWMARIYVVTGRHELLLDELASGDIVVEPALRALLTGRAQLAAGNTDAAGKAFAEAAERVDEFVDIA